MSLKRKQLHIIEESFRLLMENERTGYNQLTIFLKLQSIGVSIGRASINNLYRKKKVGPGLLKKASEGLSKLIRLELCLEYDEEQQIFKRIDGDCTKLIIPTHTGIESNPSSFFYDKKGRSFISEKTAFMADAKVAVYKVGVRLFQFTQHFTARSKEEYKVHIEKLLNNGVDYKCYLLNPNSNAARFYFEDRQKLLPDEGNSSEIIKGVINKLLRLRQEFSEKGYKGKFEIYTYSNIPYNSFLAIDPDYNGKMMIQPYIYGVLRSQCPTLQFSKRNDPDLYKLYLTALNGIINSAKKIEHKPT